MATRMGLIGVQRKEVKDLVASVMDGRLDKELSQMRQLDISIVLIEGRITWSSDGVMLGLRSRWTKAQHLGVLLSVQLRGAWVVTTTSLTETTELLLMLRKWGQKDRLGELSRRSGPTSPWGRADNKDWLYHLVQGVEGIGPVHAKAIVDKYGCPFRWNVTELDLMELDGVGVGKAEKWIRALEV